MRHNKVITEKKYAAFIEECFHKRTFDLKQMLHKHNVDGSLITTLSKLEMVILVSKGVYNWIGNTLTQSDIDGIIQLHRDRAKMYKEKRDRRKELEQGNNPESKPSITEEQAVEFLKSIGGYEIYKVERKQL